MTELIIALLSALGGLVAGVGVGVYVTMVRLTNLYRPLIPDLDAAMQAPLARRGQRWGRR